MVADAVYLGDVGEEGKKVRGKGKGGCVMDAGVDRST